MFTFYANFLTIIIAACEQLTLEHKFVRRAKSSSEATRGESELAPIPSDFSFPPQKPQKISQRKYELWELRFPGKLQVYFIAHPGAICVVDEVVEEKPSNFMPSNSSRDTHLIPSDLTLTIWSLMMLVEGGVRGVRKPQNRTEIRQKTANRTGFFPEYRNRT